MSEVQHVQHVENRAADAGTTTEATPESVAVAHDILFGPSAVEKEVQKDIAERYIEQLQMAQATFAVMPASTRFRTSSPFSLSSQLLVLVGFGIWWALLPPIGLANLGFASIAHAQDGTQGLALDPKMIVNLGIFVALLITFVVSMIVHYWGKSPSAQNAGVVANLLLGFFVGAAKNFLGILPVG